MNSRSTPMGLGVAVVSLVVAFGLYLTGAGGDVRSAAAKRADPPSLQRHQPPEIDDGALARIERVQSLLDQPGAPSGGRAVDAEFSMFGELALPEVIVVVPEPEPEPLPEVVPPPAPPAPPPFEYVVSMTYVSASSRFAVIDGSMYRVGGQLPDDARVIGIEPNSVGIERPDETRWIRVQDEPAVELRTSVPESDPPSPPLGAEAVADSRLRLLSSGEQTSEQ